MGKNSGCRNGVCTCLPALSDLGKSQHWEKVKINNKNEKNIYICCFYAEAYAFSAKNIQT